MSQVDDDIVSNLSENHTLIEVALSRVTRRTESTVLPRLSTAR